MASLLMLLALPATLLLATVEAVGFFRGFPPLPMTFPIIPLVPPMFPIHPMHLPILPLPVHPPQMAVRRPSRTKSTSNNNRNTRAEVRAVPLHAPIHNRQGDVIVVINDRDCYSGLCRGDGFGGGLGGPSNYQVHDADHVYIGGNGRY